MSFVRSVLGLSLVVALVACGASSEEEGAATNGAAAEFDTKLAPFEGFEKSIGPLPATGAAQLTLGVKAGGDLTMHGSSDVADGKLVGRSRSGKIALAAAFKMDGHLKVDTGVPGAPKYDGDLPGLADISIPLSGEVAFDPFLLGGKNADLAVKIPETKLPPIPLGTVPGKLLLTVSDKSEIHTTFSGTCVRVNAGSAAWSGQLTPSGTLVMRGSIELAVPGYSKTIDVGEIAIPIALAAKPVELTSSAAVTAADSTEGDCGAATDATPPGAATGGSTDGDDAPANPSSPPVVAPEGGSATKPTCTFTATCPGLVLGTIRGDIGADVVEMSGVGNQYVTVHVDEGSTLTTGLRLQADLVAAGGLDLGAKSLTILEGSATACATAKVVVSGTSSVSTVWADTTALENARDFLIYVAPNGPNACQPWTLKVHR